MQAFRWLWCKKQTECIYYPHLECKNERKCWLYLWWIEPSDWWASIVSCCIWPIEIQTAIMETVWMSKEPLCHLLISLRLSTISDAITGSSLPTSGTVIGKIPVHGILHEGWGQRAVQVCAQHLYLQLDSKNQEKNSNHYGIAIC